MANQNVAEVLVLHHTNVNSWLPQLLAVNRYHKYKRFPKSKRGWFIGYHHFITRTGAIIKTRNDDEEGAHTLGGWNQKSIGICLAGNFSKKPPTEAQLTALKVLIARYKLPVMFHKEADTRRTCAGRHFTHELLKTEVELLDERHKREKIQRQILKIRTQLAELKRSMLSVTKK